MLKYFAVVVFSGAGVFGTVFSGAASGGLLSKVEIDPAGGQAGESFLQESLSMHQLVSKVGGRSSWVLLHSLFLRGRGILRRQ